MDLKDEVLDVVQPVCDWLRAHRRLNDVFVGSNSDGQILEFRRQCPDVRTSAIMGDVYAARDARAKLVPPLARLVEMRFLGGMTADEIAGALGISVRTVSREWKKARAVLLSLVGE